MADRSHRIAFTVATRWARSLVPTLDPALRRPSRPLDGVVVVSTYSLGFFSIPSQQH